MHRYRPALSVALFVVVSLTLPVGVLAWWANQTVYDSETFSVRAVELLDAPSARAELADRITRELAEAGYRPAVVFRPALQFAVEVAADTEAFRSIFRGAVERFHAALLDQRGSAGGGLDLSDALSIVSVTVQLPGDAQAAGGNEALGSTLDSFTRDAADLGLWDWDDRSAEVAGGALGLAVLLSGLGIAVAVDRRRAISRLGLAVMVAGLVVLVVRALAVLAVRRLIGDPGVAGALGDGLWRVTADVEVIGQWLLGYGAVVAAAVSYRELTPAALARRGGAWVERRRAEGLGWLVVGVGLIVAGLALTASSSVGLLRLVVNVGGLWLIYLGVHELVTYLTDLPASGRPAAAQPVRGERRRLLLAGGTVAVVLAVMTAGFLVGTRRAGARAEEAGTRRCNGSVDLCDARLDQVSFPGSHNSMSATLYPGWLFGEQIPTIKAQLDNGLRAFLFDTHYGVPTNVRVPGTSAPLVVTDRGAELSAPPGAEADIDPITERRAQALRQRAPAADAQRQIYLCHNYCELGAVTFSSVLADVRSFLDANADEVLMFIIQDATTVADTTAAIEAAGLGDRVATLRRGEPLPTLGDLIDRGQRLVVFAEQGGDQAPPWYMKAYDWFQETGFTFSSVEDFNCQPNRGDPSNPLFLLNHWVGRSPPDPGVAGRVNAREVLTERIRTCEQERGLLPNIIAVDFAGRGDLHAVTEAVDDQLRGRGPQGGADTPGGGPAPTTPQPPPSTTVPPGTGGTGPDLPDLPRPTTITSLTGGDPAAFCAAYPSTIAALEAFSTAALSEAPANQGQADLAFGPVVDRALQRIVEVAPREVTASVGPLQARTGAAVAALTDLGLQASLVQVLADSGAEGAQDPAVDPLAVEQQLVERLEAAVGPTRLAEAARAFVATQGDVAADLDLGTVPADVARAAGYDCLVAT